MHVETVGQVMCCNYVNDMVYSYVYVMIVTKALNTCIYYKIIDLYLMNKKKNYLIHMRR